MIVPAVTVRAIADACGGTLHAPAGGSTVVADLLIDSRRLVHPDRCLFVALVTERNDGHRYIPELYAKGVRCFMVSWSVGQLASEGGQVNALDSDRFPGAAFIRVSDTLEALQQLGAWVRSRFSIPVIGITGSNGKTIIKEWLFQLLGNDRRIVRSPKSYNSQTGVPLSVWRMGPEHALAIFEAGISAPGEMERIARVIRPTIGLFTNVGHAHDEHFSGPEMKVREKLKLFIGAEVLVYCKDYPLIGDCLRSDPALTGLRTFTWSRTTDADLRIHAVTRSEGESLIRASYEGAEAEITIPYTDDASVENAIHCLAILCVLEGPGKVAGYLPHFSALVPVAMRLELREAVNRCSLINDSYNSDLNSLSIALDFLGQQNQHRKKTVILSDLLQTGRDKGSLYREIAMMLSSRGISRIVGIGRDLARHGDLFPMEKAFFSTTDDFLARFPISSFQDETILLKGARLFEFERIGQALARKAHETVMEVNLDAMVHNLNHYRSTLRPGTKTMAMVKAFSYGSGTFEIANLLQFHRVDYLAVAYADEGVELRKAGIRLPVLVMSPEEQGLDTILQYNLEPEIYSFRILSLLGRAIARNQTTIQEDVRVHIKFDTGMHRLGFGEGEVEQLAEYLLGHPAIRVESVFSHLAASEDPGEDEFTRLQIERFRGMSDKLSTRLGYPVLRHILNSAGITRFPEAQFDMVRLGIGLYGVGSSPAEQTHLRNVSTLKTVIIQVRSVRAGDTVGYNRRGKPGRDSLIATVPVGYADGLDRRLGNGKGVLYVNGIPAPIVGNVCMDLVMIDVTDVPGSGSLEGAEVIVFGDGHPVTEMAEAAGTIPYEVLTGISGRVKRVYFHE